MTNELPKMVPIAQQFPLSPPLNVDETIEQQFRRFHTVKPGARIAMAVGSRGITNLSQIVGAIIRILKSAGAKPFIIPAMGSHGGATPEGQASLLAEYGITEQLLGVPVRASLEVERIGSSPEGIDVFCSVEAMHSDGVILINRIKPHTDFSGRIGSGILKMSVIGLGKRLGAAQYHVGASRFGYEEVLRSLAKVVIRTAPILCGVGIIENQRHQTANIALVARDEIETREEQLFLEAKVLMPKLPLDDIDFLIVDYLGKNISGAGMDPNIIGRGVHGYSSLLGQRNVPPPRIKRIFVRDLTAESHGNAIGIGFADLTTTRLVQKIDRSVTYINALTSLTPNGAKIPIHFDTDRQALELGLKSLGLADPSQAIIVRIADTLSLESVEISESALAKLNHCQVKGPARPMEFDSAGNLSPLDAVE